MSKDPGKDFGPIADDYAFFEVHATEAEQDARAFAADLAGLAPAGGTIRLLDFGCGSGSFTARLIEQAGWAPEQLRLTLVEPGESARRQAEARLGGFSRSPVAVSAELPAGRDARFDVVLANHVFYYVPELTAHLAKLIGLLSPSGLFLAAIAGRANALLEIWEVGFGSVGREVPYHAAEDVEAALQELGAAYRKEQVPYELTFPDTEENRMKILRFLLGEHLPRMPLRPLMDLFDRHARGGRIQIRTASEHFVIRAGQNAS